MLLGGTSSGENWDHFSSLHYFCFSYSLFRSVFSSVLFGSSLFPLHLFFTQDNILLFFFLILPSNTNPLCIHLDCWILRFLCFLSRNRSFSLVFFLVSFTVNSFISFESVLFAGFSFSKKLPSNTISRIPWA